MNIVFPFLWWDVCQNSDLIRMLTFACLIPVISVSCATFTTKF